MRVRVLGASGGLVPNRNLICFQVNDDTVIDAGSVAQTLPIEEQATIDHVILTHAHLDHSGNLPFFVDNIFGMRDKAFVVHSIPETLKDIIMPRSLASSMVSLEMNCPWSITFTPRSKARRISLS